MAILPMVVIATGAMQVVGRSMASGQAAMPTPHREGVGVSVYGGLGLFMAQRKGPENRPTRDPRP